MRVFDHEEAHKRLFWCVFLDFVIFDALGLGRYSPLVWARKFLSILPFIGWLSAFGLSPGQPVDPGFASLPKVMLFQYNESRRLKRLKGFCRCILVTTNRLGSVDHRNAYILS